MYTIAFIFNGIPYLIYGAGKSALSHTLEYESLEISHNDHSIVEKNLCLNKGTIPWILVYSKQS